MVPIGKINLRKVESYFEVVIITCLVIYDNGYS